MQHFLIVAAGGAIGASLRYLSSSAVERLVGPGFPWGTLAANMLACLVMGLVWYFGGKELQRQSAWVALLVIGFCGGFSTFSTFSFETLRLLREGMFFWAAGNVVLSVAACLLILHLLVKPQ